MPNDLPPFDLNRYVPYRLAVAADQLSKELARQYRDRFGISIAEWRVLVNVAYSDNASIRDIERRVCLEKSKVSRAASRLEQAGYLTKAIDENDRRLLNLGLTDAGATLIAELVPLAEAYQADLETRLNSHFGNLQNALDTLVEPAVK